MQETFSAKIRKSGQTSSSITIPHVIKEKMKLQDDTIVKVTLEK